MGWIDTLEKDTEYRDPSSDHAVLVVGVFPRENGSLAASAPAAAL